MCCLIKPQFEAGKEQVGKKGVVRDKKVHIQVLERFLDMAGNCGFSIKGITYSPIKGPEGNIEFLGHLAAGGEAPWNETASCSKAQAEPMIETKKAGAHVRNETIALVEQAHEALRGG